MKHLLSFVLLVAIIGCGNSYSKNDKSILETKIDSNNYYAFGAMIEDKQLMIKFNSAYSNLYNKHNKNCETELGIKKQGLGKAPYSDKDIDKLDKCAVEKVLNDISGLTVKEFLNKYR